MDSSSNFKDTFQDLEVLNNNRAEDLTVTVEVQVRRVPPQHDDMVGSGGEDSFSSFLYPLRFPSRPLP